jgi:catechol 2,3-dioxygenase-like lactoylglutathione lyase family enzyme
MIKIGSIVWGVTDINRAIRFWSEALHYRLLDEPSSDWAKLGPISGEGFQLSLKLITSPHARRHHIDLFTDDLEYEKNRLILLGAKEVKNWIYPKDADYVVLEDPDGNRFCIVQK